MRPMKPFLLLRPLLVVSIAAASALPLPAQTPAPAFGEHSWTLSSAVTSAYLFRGVRRAGVSFQPALDFYSGPLALGAWSNVALDEVDGPDRDPEIDFYGSYTFASADGTRSLVPGVTVYTYPDSQHTAGLHAVTVEPSLAANLTVRGVRLTPTIYYDAMLEGATYEFTAATAWPLTTWGTELALALTAGTFRWNDLADTSPAVKNWGDYWTASVTLPVQIGLRSQLALNVTYSEGRNNFYKSGRTPREANPDADRRAAVTLSYAHTF